MGVRVARGELTVVLGPAIVRRRLMAMLDDGGPGVRRCDVGRGDAAGRVRRIESLAGDAPTVVLAERVTAGLDARGRRLVLVALRGLARSGPAVLVDDDDAVAALAVADATLRADPRRGLTVEPVELPALSA